MKTMKWMKTKDWAGQHKQLPSVHLTLSPAGDNNGVSKTLLGLNVARFLSG